MIRIASGKKSGKKKGSKTCCPSLKSAQCCAKETKTLSGCHD